MAASRGRSAAGRSYIGCHEPEAQATATEARAHESCLDCHPGHGAEELEGPGHRVAVAVHGHCGAHAALQGHAQDGAPLVGRGVAVEIGLLAVAGGEEAVEVGRVDRQRLRDLGPIALDAGELEVLDQSVDAVERRNRRADQTADECISADWTELRYRHYQLSYGLWEDLFDAAGLEKPDTFDKIVPADIRYLTAAYATIFFVAAEMDIDFRR